VSWQDADVKACRGKGSQATFSVEADLACDGQFYRQRPDHA
jgi:hypothetical protein